MKHINLKLAVFLCGLEDLLVPGIGQRVVLSTGAELYHKLHTNYDLEYVIISNKNDLSDIKPYNKLGG